MTLTAIRHSSVIVVRAPAFGDIFHTQYHPERHGGPPRLLVSGYRKDFWEEVPPRASWKENAWTLTSKHKNWG
jgi:hypothetical protein